MLKVGDKRSFSFLSEPCEIVEILDNPEIKLLWKWRDDICPHCKKRIEKVKEHVFTRIELLIPRNKMNVDILQKKHHLIILGFDKEGKTMLLPKEKYPEVISKSSLWR